VLAKEDSLMQGGPPGADPRWRYLRADEHARWEGFLKGYTAQDAELAKQRWPVARRIVSAMHQAGVPIMAGMMNWHCWVKKVRRKAHKYSGTHRRVAVTE
jgi:hypothetical protein